MSTPKHKPVAVYSKISVKSQTVLPREVRERLRIACIEPSRIIRRSGKLAPGEAKAVLRDIVSFIGEPKS